MAIPTSSLQSILFCSSRCILFLTKIYCNIFHFSILYTMFPCLLIRVEYCPKAHLFHLVLPESLHNTLFLKVSQKFLFCLFSWTNIKFHASGVTLQTATHALCSVLLPFASPAQPGHSVPLSAQRFSPGRAALLSLWEQGHLSRVTTWQSRLHYLLAKGFEEGVRRKTGKLQDFWWLGKE